MLQHLDRTLRLRALYNYPEHPDAAGMLPNISTALAQEVSEVINELKPWWAWWSHKPVDRVKLVEELADVMFFILLYTLHAREYCFGVKQDHVEEHWNMTESVSRQFYGFDRESQKHPNYRETVLMNLRQMQREVAGSDSKPHQALYSVISSFYGVLSLLDVSPALLECAYLRKFLVNIQRTGQLHSDAGAALYLEVKGLLEKSEAELALSVERAA